MGSKEDIRVLCFLLYMYKSLCVMYRLSFFGFRFGGIGGVGCGGSDKKLAPSGRRSGNVRQLLDARSKFNRWWRQVLVVVAAMVMIIVT